MPETPTPKRLKYTQNLSKVQLEPPSPRSPPPFIPLKLPLHTNPPPNRLRRRPLPKLLQRLPHLVMPHAFQGEPLLCLLDTLETPRVRPPRIIDDQALLGVDLFLQTDLQDHPSLEYPIVFGDGATFEPAGAGFSPRLLLGG